MRADPFKILATPKRPAFFISVLDSVLQKAGIKTKPVKVNLGKVHGLPVIAIGKNGGKIVAYRNGKPIYASSKVAQTMIKQLAQKETSKKKLVGQWLLDVLGFPNQTSGDFSALHADQGKQIAEAFGLTPIHKGPKVWSFKTDDLKAHVGKPMPMSQEEQTVFAAEMAAGDDDGTFPDLDKLKQIPAGKFAGSHGNTLFVDPKGRKWIFKSEDPTIARAEEAASRIGRLVMGDKIPPAKMVELNGQSGVIIGEVPGEPLNATSHSNPPNFELSENLEDVVAHHMVDWLTSNHDGHAGNYLVTDAGLNGIDKGQAWKFFGKDKLDKDYSPNPSHPIFNKFWNSIAPGKEAAVAKAASKTLAKIGQISEQQFQTLIAPYVSTAAAHSGFDAQKRLKAMTARLTDLQHDWEVFLSGVYGHEVKLSPDNWETMPDKEGQSFKITGAPEKPKEIPSKPITEGAAGWPKTKGKVTVFHPGNAPTGGWPAGYPGPGFKAQVEYKKQKYTIEFMEDPGKSGISVRVYYPSGDSEYFDSPNKASDALYLWHNNLPTDMSATEKKQKKISYPAKKAFGIVAFQSELQEGIDLPDSAKTVEQLDAETTEPAAELTAAQMVAKMPPGEITDHGSLPFPVLDFLHESWSKTVGPQYEGLIHPGVPIKTKSGNIVIARASPSFGTVQYFVWNATDDYAGEGGLIPQKVIEPSLKELAIDHLAPLKLAEAEAPQTPPPAVLPPEVKVPPTASKNDKGPLPSGSTHIVQKKFPWGKQKVFLGVSDAGIFSVGIPGKEPGQIHAKDFKTLSAASDWVWVVQKGFTDAEEYKAKTGKKKVPSGGGWKFWGITPGEVVEPETPKVMTESKPVGGEAESKWKPLIVSKKSEVTENQLDDLPSGTKIKYSYDFGTGTVAYNKHYEATKIGDKWMEVELGVGGPAKQNENIHLDLSGEDASNVQVLMPTIEQIVAAKGKVSADNWETMPDSETVTGSWEHLDKMPIGSRVYWTTTTEGKTVQKVATKMGKDMLDSESWMVFNITDDEAVKRSGDWVANVVHKKSDAQWTTNTGIANPSTAVTDAPPIAGFPDPLEGMPTMWGDPNTVMFTASFLKAQPVGTQLKHEKDLWIKATPGIWKNLTTGENSFEGILAGALKGKPVQMRGLDPEKFKAGAKGSAAVEVGVPPGMAYWADLKLVAGDAKAITQSPPDEALENAPEGMLILIDHPTDGKMTFYSMGDGVWKASGPAAPDEWKQTSPSTTDLSSWIDGVFYDIEKEGMGGSVSIAVPKPTPLFNLGGGQEYEDLIQSKLDALPAGTVINAKDKNGDVTWTKEEDGDWAVQFTGAMGLPSTNVMDPFQTSEAMKVDFGDSKFEPVVASAAQAVVVDTAPSKVSLASVIDAWGPFIDHPIGTVYEYTNADGKPVTIKKVTVDGYIATTATGKASKWKSDQTADILSDAGFNNVTVTTASEEKEEAPKPKKPKPKPDPKVEEAKKKAQEIAEWAKGHPTITDSDVLHVLAHLQAEIDFQSTPWARMEGDDVIIGPIDTFDDSGLTDIGIHGEPVDTPVGSALKFNIKKLKSELPKAGTIQSPHDGKLYPAGTKFKQKTIETTAKTMIEAEPAFKKWKEHQSDSTKLVLKIAGTGDEQTKQAKEITTKWGVDYTGLGNQKNGEPIKGSGNTLIFVDKADLEKVAKTEEFYEPQIPKQPEPFVSTSLPGLAGAAVWEDVVSDPGQLASIPGMDMPRFGHTILMGKPGTWRDYQVRVRRVKDKAGNVYHEVTGQLHELPDKAVLGAHLQYKGALTGMKYGTFDAGTTTHVDQDHGITQSGYEGEMDSGTKISIIDDSPTFSGVFRARIPEGADIQKELAAALEHVGVDSKAAMAKHDAKTTRIWKKWSVLKAYKGPKGWNSELKGAKNITQEAYLDKELKKLGPEAVALAETAQIKRTFQGHASVVLDDGQRFKDAGWKFAHRHDKDLDSLFYQISQGGGWASRKHKYLSGNFSGGWSSASDIHNGGATGNFLRISTSGNAGYDNTIVFHPRIFERADWWRYDSDNYGKISSQGNGSFSDGVPRHEPNKGISSGNEIMFYGGTSLEDVMCVVVSSESDKKTLINKLKLEEITEVNGVSLDDFILVGGTNIMDRIHPDLKA